MHFMYKKLQYTFWQSTCTYRQLGISWMWSSYSDFQIFGSITFSKLSTPPILSCAFFFNFPFLYIGGFNVDNCYLVLMIVIDAIYIFTWVKFWYWWIYMSGLGYEYSSAKSLFYFCLFFIMQVSDLDSTSQHHSIISSTKTILSSTALKQSQRHEGSGRIIRSILSNKDLRRSQFSRGHSEQQIQTSNLEREKQSTRPSHVQLILKGADGIPENRITVHDLHVFGERQERSFRHKDKHDRGVWTSCSNGGDDSVIFCFLTSWSFGRYMLFVTYDLVLAIVN